MNFEELSKKLKSFFLSYKILNNLPDMILYLDYNGIIIQANSCAEANFGTLENITIDELFNEGFKAVRQSAKYNKYVLVETKTPNEYFELTAQRIDKNYFVCIRDNSKTISDNIEKEGIEKFNNEKNAFIARLDNEIKAPLNTITGFCQGLVDGIGGEITQKQSKYLKIIQANANELSKFMEKFIEFSYSESLIYEPEYKNFDIISEIKNIISEFEKSSIYTDGNIDFYYEGFETRNIYGDYKAINKLIMNILETIFYSSASCDIQILLSYPDYDAFITYGLDENKKYIQIKIKNSISAFSSEDLKHICNPYAQLNKGKKQITRSLMLGLVSILSKRANGFFNISADNGNLYSIIIPVEKEKDE